MTAHALFVELRRFTGQQLIVAIDDIRRIALAHGYSVNVIDPEFNTGSIDHESKRLNVRTDKTSVITSFAIG